MIVPVEGTAPTLDELRAFLTARAMTEWWLPTQVRLVEALPRNATGKVVKEELRRRVRAGIG